LWVENQIANQVGRVEIGQVERTHLRVFFQVLTVESGGIGGIAEMVILG